MNELKPIEYDDRRVLLTSQLAELYGTIPEVISKNYTRNKERYKENLDYAVLQGEDLKAFKTGRQFDDQLKHTPKLYLWYEHGALLHAKSLGTDEAWQTYGQLVDTYFMTQEMQRAYLQTQPPSPALVPIDNILEQLADMRTTFIQMLQSEHSEMVRRHTEIINGQRLMHKYVKSIWNACRPEFHVSEWKNEVYKLASQIQESEPEKYKNNKAVLSEYYKEMRDVYGFVAEQSAKEFKERNNITYNPYTIDLIAADEKLRDVFMNLLKSHIASLTYNLKGMDAGCSALGLNPVPEIIKPDFLHQNRPVTPNRPKQQLYRCLKHIKKRPLKEMELILIS